MPTPNTNGNFRWIIGSIAASFLLSVAVSASVSVFIMSTVDHPVTKEEHVSMQEDVREIRRDVKVLLGRK